MDQNSLKGVLFRGYLSAWPHQPRALDENLKLGERMFKTLYNLSLTKLDDLYIYLERELNTKFG